MSLNLSTLQVGDIVKRTNLTVPHEVVAIGPLDIVLRSTITGRHMAVENIDAQVWSVVVPPPPCPITEPVTLRKWQHDGRAAYWASGAAGTGKQPITLHPPGAFAVRQMPEQHGIYTWGES